MSKIGLQDSMMDIVMKMSEGNPGAVSVLMQLMEKGKEIEPQDALNPLGQIFALDTHKVYGSHIWILYKDICEENIRTLIMLLRAVQLGFFSEERIQQLSQYPNPGKPLTSEDIDALDQQVCDRLESFQRVVKEEISGGE